MDGDLKILNNCIAADPDVVTLCILSSLNKALKNNFYDENIRVEMYSWKLSDILAASPAISLNVLRYFLQQDLTVLTAPVGLTPVGENLLEVIGEAARSIIKYIENGNSLTELAYVVAGIEHDTDYGPMLKIFEDIYAIFFMIDPSKTISQMQSLLTILPQTFRRSLAKVFIQIINENNSILINTSDSVTQAVRYITLTAGEDA